MANPCCPMLLLVLLVLSLPLAWTQRLLSEHRLLLNDTLPVAVPLAPLVAALGRSAVDEAAIAEVAALSELSAGTLRRNATDTLITALLASRDAHVEVMRPESDRGVAVIPLSVRIGHDGAVFVADAQLPFPFSIADYEAAWHGEEKDEEEGAARVTVASLVGQRIVGVEGLFATAVADEALIIDDIADALAAMVLPISAVDRWAAVNAALPQLFVRDLLRSPWPAEDHVALSLVAADGARSRIRLPWLVLDDIDLSVRDLLQKQGSDARVIGEATCMWRFFDMDVAFDHWEDRDTGPLACGPNVTDFVIDLRGNDGGTICFTDVLLASMIGDDWPRTGWSRGPFPMRPTCGCGSTRARGARRADVGAAKT